jgi:hypothetical protein
MLQLIVIIVPVRKFCAVIVNSNCLVYASYLCFLSNFMGWGDHFHCFSGISLPSVIRSVIIPFLLLTVKLKHLPHFRSLAPFSFFILHRRCVRHSYSYRATTATYTGLHTPMGSSNILNLLETKPLSKYNIRIQFVPRGKHITSPLQI